MKLILFVALILPSISSAEDIFDVAEKYNSKKKEVINLESEKREMLSEIYNLEKKTRKIVEEKSELGTKKVQLEVSLQKTSKNIVEIEKDLKELTPNLQKRLTYAHQLKDMPWMHMFLSAYNVTDLDRMVKTLDNMNNQEAKLTLEYIQKLEELNQYKKQLKTIAGEMIHLNKNIIDKEQGIKNQHLMKKKLLGIIENSIDKNKRDLTHIKQKGHILTQRKEYKNLSLLFGTTFFDKKGNLPHPVEDPISHEFGLNKSLLQDNVQLMHKGIFYSSKSGTSVKAIEEGRVKFAKHISGLGKIVIIDHGGRYYSVYKNLKTIKIKENDVVKAKQAFATTGSNKWHFGEGLYFEIRHFSEAEDPLNWLIKRDEKQIAGI